MSRCPHCEYPLPDDRERVGARCPSCHDPIYEPPLRFSRKAREDEPTCAAHPGMESVSVCARCNQHLCETCRTKWRNVIVCAGCADRALASDTGPSRATLQIRQGKGALIFSGGAYLLALVGLAGLWLFASGSDFGTVMTFLSLVLIAGAALPACVGMGQAIAALRSAGERRILALVGLVLGGLYVGGLVGLGTLALWQS